MMNLLKKVLFSLLGMSLVMTSNLAMADAKSEIATNATQESSEAQEEKNILKRSELPEGCELKSYLQNGLMGKYICDKKEVLIGLVLPEDSIDLDKIIEMTLKEPSCDKNVTKTVAGKVITCKASADLVYKTYLRQNNSGIIQTAVIHSDMSDSDIIALENLTLEIYFYKRGVAKDTDRIQYLKDLQDKAKECTDGFCIFEP